MRIVLFQFYSKTPNPHYQNLARALRSRGHTVFLGQPNPEFDLCWHDGEEHISIVRGPRALSGMRRRIPLVSTILNKVNSFMFILRVRNSILDLNPDIVQVNPYEFTGVITLGLPKRIRFIFEVNQINLGVRNDFIGRIKERLVLVGWRLNARFLFDRACFHHEKSAQKILGRDWHRWGTVVPVGVSSSFLNTNLPTNKSNGITRFIYIGAITTFRNLERLLEAAQLLLATNDEFQLHLVGPDRSDRFYQGLVERMEIGSVVSIKEPVPYQDIPELLSNYDVGLAYVPERPTWHFQPTIKVLEYRAIGLPILSSDVASHRDVVEHGVNGLFFEDSVESLVAGMGKFVNDHTFLGRCKDNAQAMRRGLIWDEVAEMFERKVYDQQVKDSS